MILPSKLPKVGETIFSVMTQMAVQHQAINLGQGFPDFEMDHQLIDLVSQAMKEGKNQYAPATGVLALREALSKKIFELYKAQIHPQNEICVTPGATYAIYTALTTVLNPGDEVIIFEPAYDSYIPGVEVNGAKPVLIPLQFPDYKIDWNQVKDKITPATKMIIINSPHNPTGVLLDENDMKALHDIVKDTHIFILSDEVYEHLTFDGKKHESILKYPELFQRSFITFSFGKVYNCTGWKTGYTIAPADLMKEYIKVHQYNCFCCFAPVQYALASFLENKEGYLSIGKMLQDKRDYFSELMQQTKFEPLPSYGSYFQLYKYDQLSDLNELDFAKSLIKKVGVATIPVSAFYQEPVNNGVIRFCFAKRKETLEKAAERLIHVS